MAVALPILAIAGGAAAAATAITAVGVIAGVASVVSGVAALAGKPKIAKIAGIVALGAGAFNLVAGAASNAGAAAELAGPPASAAGEATATEAVLNASRGNTAIADAAAATDIGTNISGVVDGVAAGTGIPEAAASVVDTGTQTALAPPYGGGQSMMPGTPPLSGETVPASLSMLERAGSPVQTSFLDSLKKVGQVLKENKELVDIGGGMLKGAFGAEAQMLDVNKQRLSLLQQQQAYDEQQRQRENANANNLVGLRNPLIFNPNAPMVRRTT